MDRKQMPEAEAQFRAELAIQPQYASAHYNRGVALRNVNRLDEAASEWEEALQHDANHLNSMGELMAYYSMRGEQAKAAYYMDQLSQRGMRFTSPPASLPMPSGASARPRQ